ncbi:type V CRISPR-associated protein Cas12a/Cpf1 [Sulfurimonas sp.]|uniref:type V CRISPR-associated protein Cas12a/Cpf1 n=1 Tax=Sulfurimonas sp. TaxID=2022749 RepID=UPI0025FBF143|nr:type V CRISPR-associated protein Cas12a/Cpf1 [Sulfurimonas sp.]MBW6487721.1 type V CRISPR-associated protein Cas12a/Cpf1 [Sulfurimonas sp.]
MLDQFKNQYALSKTLRFELKPLGETLKHIEAKGLIAQDKTRAEEYQEVKTVIDKYHKAFIEEALDAVSLSKLEDYEIAFFDKNRDEKAFEKLQDVLRKEIVVSFKKHPKFATLFKKELIKLDLKNWQNLSEEEKELVKHFDNFTTYFTGFHENRANMYTDEAKHSSIAYRIIHENLPIFLTNQKLFETIKQKAPHLAQETQNALLEHLNGAVVEDMFELSYFNRMLSQTHINLYNQMIGGIKKDELKIQGFNEKINLYRQAKGLSKRDLPNLKPLHKQILSDRETLSWLPEAFENYEELVKGVQTYFGNEVLAFECCDGKVNLLEKLPELLAQTQDYDLSKIYFKNDVALTSASQVIFKDYRIIKEALWEVNKPKKSKDLAADEEKFFNKKNSYFSIEQIDGALKSAQLSVKMMEYFQSESSKLIEQIQTAYNDWKQNSSNKELLKTFLDTLLSYQRLLKPLNAPNDLEKDVAFYAYFDSYFASLSGVVKLYDKVRNFMTKKPYSLEKFKLNFENPELLGGWPVDREIATSSVIFKKDGLFYLGILSSGSKRFFKNHPLPTDKTDVILKMNYLQAADPSKDVQNLMVINGKTVKKNGRKEKSGEFAGENLQLESLKNQYLPNEINEIRKAKSYSKMSITFNKNDLVKFIDYYKQRTIEYFNQYSFEFNASENYKDFGEFTEHINQQAYQIKFVEISQSYLNSLVDAGKLYLFQIYNKDFSPFSKGTPNMHTLYWRALFDEKNLADVIYKLNGQAEIFFRQKSIDYSEEKLKLGHHHNTLKDKFAYPIIKDRRFAFDKFQFHVPITLNFKAKGNENITPQTFEYIRANPDNIKVIGIDRGERHLLYLSLIDAKGQIVEQFTLNQIVNSYNSKEHVIDYHAKLDAKEKDRDKARKEWGTVENIKELKEGYLSHVIHKIATLIVEHGAIVAMEDLNFGFKRGRFKVEKQVYQKFEKALIDKLNYLVDKKKQPDELGGIFNALQLTNKFQSFEKMGKQNGFLFYVPAWNTSKIDPVAGFVDLFDTRYASVEKSKAFFAKFKSICYNETKDYFEFAFDYNDFTDKAKETRSEWTLCTYGERIVSFRNAEKNHQWDNKTLHLTTEFKNLFGNYTGDLKATILAHDDKEFFEKLLRLLRFTLQMRNSITGTDIDYLVSPVADKQGNFYDSRKAHGLLPKDADANGAYNIARKGLMLMRRIQKADDLKKVNLAISNRDWLRYAQGLES